MKTKKIVCVLLTLIMSLCFLMTSVGCDLLEFDDTSTHTCSNVCKICQKCTNEDCKDVNCQDKCQGHEPTNDDLLADSLKKSLKVYFESENFTKTIANAKTAAAWVPLTYLKYVKGNFYSYDNARIFLKYLNMIDELLVKDENGQYVLSNAKWSASSACAQGWYGITDYLYTWSICYNLYSQYCHENGIVDNHFDTFLQPIGRYLTYIDTWLGNSSNTYEIRWVSGDTITQANLYYQGYNCFNSLTYSRIKDYDYDYWVSFMEIVAKATGNTEGHDAFLKAFNEFWPSAGTLSNTELRPIGKALLAKFKDCLPVTQVAFGYSAYSHLACIKASLGLEIELPKTDIFFLSYYEKNEDGSWKKSGGTPNWVGPSGRPIAASLYRNNENYSVIYEKSMQGYFPFTDGWNQTIDEMINLDRLCNYYNHELGTGANVTPQWALLTAMMHGINMEHYKKVVPLVDEENGINEDGTEEFNVITLWKNNLKQDENGDYIISGNVDAAVAIAYIAMHQGIEAPSPFGVYSAENAIIEL